MVSQTTKIEFGLAPQAWGSYINDISYQVDDLGLPSNLMQDSDGTSHTYNRSPMSCFNVSDIDYIDIMILSYWLMFGFLEQPNLNPSPSHPECPKQTLLLSYLF